MTYTERARALRPYIEKAAVSLPDEDALQAVELFSQWVTGHAYSVDERLQYNAYYIAWFRRIPHKRIGHLILHLHYL